MPQASVKPAFSFDHQTTHRHKHTKNLKHASSAQFERGSASEAAKHRSPPLCIRRACDTARDLKPHTDRGSHTHTESACKLAPSPSPVGSVRVARMPCSCQRTELLMCCSDACVCTSAATCAGLCHYTQTTNTPWQSHPPHAHTLTQHSTRGGAWLPCPFLSLLGRLALDGGERGIIHHHHDAATARWRRRRRQHKP